MAKFIKRAKMKKVVITGGNKGIGLETTKLFLESGYSVIVIARNIDNSNLLQHSNLEYISFDLTQIDKIDDLVNQIGCIDVLINNAGVMYSIPYTNYPTEKIESMINLNLKAPVELITKFSDLMIKNGGGRIVNNASIAAHIGHPDVWYGITKAGILNATKSFSKMLGSHGIIINAVAAGPVETDMLAVIPEDRKNAIKNSVITNRFAKPQEIAKTMFWLGTESPEYINGVCIDINNGAFLR